MQQEKHSKYCFMCGKYLFNDDKSVCSSCYYKTYRLMKVFLTVIEKKFAIQPEEYLNFELCKKIDIREIFSMQKYWTRKDFIGQCKFCKSTINLKDGLLICENCFFSLLQEKIIPEALQNNVSQKMINKNAIKKFKKNVSIPLVGQNPYKTFLQKRQNCSHHSNKAD